MRKKYFFGWLAAAFFFLFVVVAYWGESQEVSSKSSGVSGRVVISAPVLVALFAGDRFLAANLEVMRLAATGNDSGQVNAEYLIRAQRVVSELNACHEDNYYLANGLLAWGGAISEGNEILQRAVGCRFWDGVPSFFYGVNQVFFSRDREEGIKAFELSAERWPDNAVMLRRLAISLRAERFSDERLAMNYLAYQRDSTDDSRLRSMLDKRVIRLQGLIKLREAQRRYEVAHGSLTDIQQLIGSGELDSIPQDPLRLGYELREGRIEMKRLKIAGMEGQP